MRGVLAFPFESTLDSMEDNYHRLSQKQSDSFRGGAAVMANAAQTSANVDGPWAKIGGPAANAAQT